MISRRSTETDALARRRVIASINHLAEAADLTGRHDEALIFQQIAVLLEDASASGQFDRLLLTIPAREKPPRNVRPEMSAADLPAEDWRPVLDRAFPGLLWDPVPPSAAVPRSRRGRAAMRCADGLRAIADSSVPLPAALRSFFRKAHLWLRAPSASRPRWFGDRD